MQAIDRSSSIVDDSTLNRHVSSLLSAFNDWIPDVDTVFKVLYSCHPTELEKIIDNFDKCVE